MPRHVQPLPPAVAMRLRAGPVAVDVAQCVEELVMNAVDAGAQRVAIEVHNTTRKSEPKDGSVLQPRSQLVPWGTS